MCVCLFTESHKNVYSIQFIDEKESHLSFLDLGLNVNKTIIHYCLFCVFLILYGCCCSIFLVACWYNKIGWSQNKETKNEVCKSLEGKNTIIVRDFPEEPHKKGAEFRTESRTA